MSRVGLWGARADRRGLAIQNEEFARHMDPVRILGIQMQPRQSPYHNDWSGYDTSRLDVQRLEDLPAYAARFLDQVDAVFSAETPYWDPFYSLANSRGVRTVLQPNWEFFRWVKDPDIPRPDLFAAPSTWHYDEIPEPKCYLPAPVNRDKLPFQLRTSVYTFVHPIGHPAGADRAGTNMLAEAAAYLKNPCHIIIRTRKPFPQRYGAPEYVKISYEVQDFPDYASVYAGADAVVLPRRYGGQSLPLNEASSLGLPVIALDRIPEREILLPELLIPCHPVKQCSVQPGTINVYGADPKALAAAMDNLTANPDLVTLASKHADCYAESISWKTLKPRYEELLCR